MKIDRLNCCTSLAFLTAVCLTGSIAFGQRDGGWGLGGDFETGNQVQVPEESEIRVFALQHAKKDDIVRLALDLFGHHGMLITADERTNSIWVRGTVKDLDMLSRLIENADQEVTQDEIVKVFANSNGLGGEAAARLIGELFGHNSHEGMRFAVDPRTNGLVVSGNARQLELVEQLLGRLMDNTVEQPQSVASANCAVRITWLTESDSDYLQGIGEEQLVQETSDSLGELVAELHRHNLVKKPGVLTTTQTLVSSGGNSRGSAGRFTIANVSKLVEMQGSGEVQAIGDGQYRLEININLGAEGTKLPIGTELNLPAGHPVAFCVTDVGNFRSAIVIEILERK